MPHGSLGHVNLSMNQGIKVERILLNLDPSFEPNYVRMNLLMNTIRKESWTFLYCLRPSYKNTGKEKLPELTAGKLVRTSGSFPH